MSPASGPCRLCLSNAHPLRFRIWPPGREQERAGELRTHLQRLESQLEGASGAWWGPVGEQLARTLRRGPARRGDNGGTSSSSDGGAGGSGCKSGGGAQQQVQAMPTGGGGGGAAR